MHNNGPRSRAGNREKLCLLQGKGFSQGSPKFQNCCGCVTLSFKFAWDGKLSQLASRLGYKSWRNKGLLISLTFTASLFQALVTFANKSFSKTDIF